MRGFVSIILASSFLSFPAMAQTYEEVQQQQQLYSERVRAEMEMQMQREELERIREENKRTLEEQKYQIEQQQNEIIKLKQKSQFNYVSPELKIEEGDSLSKKSLQEVEEQEEAERTKAFVDEKSGISSVVFNDDYLTEIGKGLSKNAGLNPEQVSRIQVATKFGILKTEDRANQGSVVDQRKLARLFLDGQFIKQNNELGVKWLTKAAENGDVEAQSLLGELYFDGKVLPKDDLNSYKWYRKAADRGYANAQYIVGLRYFYGRGVQQDDIEAAYWLMLAGRNHADLLEAKENKMLLATALEKLSVDQRKAIEIRLANWKANSE